MDSVASQVRENTLIAEEILFDLLPLVQPGISTWELHRKAEERYIRRRVLPSAPFLGSPHSISIAVNEEVVFGVISPEKLFLSGDIVKIDLGVFKNGVFSDLGVSTGVGHLSVDSAKLVHGTGHALLSALNTLFDQVTVGEISTALESTLRNNRISPIPQICSHAIGRHPHERPFVPSVTTLPFVDYEDRLSRGVIICIEPFGTNGSGQTSNGACHPLSTTDAHPVAYFELPVFISDSGPEVLAKQTFSYIVATLRNDQVS